MRVELPVKVEEIVKAYAKRFGGTPGAAANRLMDDLAVAFEDGAPAFLGPTWQKVCQPEEATTAGKPDVQDETLSDEQLDLLQLSGKLASGFAYVYAANGGWRGQGANGKMLTTRKTPARAAWDRYLSFQENNLPYNPSSLDETIAWLRSRNPQASEEELRREAQELEALKGGTAPGM